MRDALCASEPGIGLVIQWVVLALLALSAWLVLRTGRISLGQQAYFGLGAYAAALSTVMMQASMAWALLAAVAAGSVMAALIGWALRHFSGLHYAMATLAVAELFRLGLSAFEWRVQASDGSWVGPEGIQGFRHIRWLFDHQVSQESYLTWAGALLTLTVVGLMWIQRSRLGLLVRAVGLDSVLAQSQGTPTHQVRWATQTVAGALAALAGALYAHQMTYVEPAIFDVMLGVHAVGYAMLGGLATPLGPLLGSGLDLGLLEATRVFEGWRMVIFGGLIALFLRWRPRGLLDEDVVHQVTQFFHSLLSSLSFTSGPKDRS